MISLNDVCVRLGNFSLNVSMDVHDGAVVVIFGPNGSGKTTLLETIVGFHKPAAGSIVIDGVDVTGMPPEKRGVGYVPQDCLLFPHLSVVENIRFATRSKLGDGDILKTLDMFSVKHLADRYPRFLSGGERQRVALARALAISPHVLLLDEPFSSLDAGACQCIRKEIAKIQKDLGITTVLVTHNPEEAEEMGDRIITIVGGKIRETETQCFCGSQNAYNTYNTHNTQNCAGCTIDCYCKR